MDTPTDFIFLEESIAKKCNPKFGDREYLVIQTYPLGKTIRVVYRSYDYCDADQKCQLESLSHDYSCFATRIYHDGKLWIPGNMSGIPYKISEEQFWEIHPDYKSSDADGEIEICDCSYLYFVGRTSILTCLKNDNGRSINICPNCAATLQEEEEDDDDFVPSACRGCTNYHGDFYGDIQLICAIHPSGWSDDNCPDFSVDID
ncbi:MULTISPECIES: hypothetical protein [Nostoc]|uniref:Uncharacterized protein n=1 Tax=Nostoc paludosum FACHB-159 TaxID=2692908 RepID=A0ABR8KI44_9NOSO|nr:MULTISPECIES: hypothetical protein [Nostoc]MBD2682876.1 hypothetical protein [Nostoc sp. FACHB-857]MBD2739213.1 hypothetical protein [Nostoc paludosum FACHB-159]